MKLEWVDWDVADKTHPYPRTKLVDRDELVRAVWASGVRVCGNCHQHAPGQAPVIDGVGVALSMREWGGVMYDAENDQNEDAMGYCDWAWNNAECRVCGKTKGVTP